MPNSKFITVSQKIEKREEAERLKNIIKENLNLNYGMIIRTAANGRTENDIVKYIKCLERRWEKIKNTASYLLLKVKIFLKKYLIIMAL